MAENLKFAVEITMENGQFKAEVINSEQLTKRFGKTGESAFKGLADEAARVPGPVGRISSSVQQLGVFMRGTAGAILAGVAALAAYAVAMLKGTQIAAQHERQLLRMEAQLKATGNASGKTAEQINEASERLNRQTLFSDDQIREAQGRLLTFTSVTGQSFDRAMSLATDLAAVMGTDLSSAVTMLGKALEDPAEGLTALSRAGVKFTDEQERVIKALFESGRQGEALAAVLDAVQAKVGGAAQREAEGYAGSIHRLGESWEDFLEALQQTGPLGFAIELLDKLAQAGKFFIDSRQDAEYLELLRERQRIVDKLENAAASPLSFLEFGTTKLEADLAEVDKQLKSFRAGYAAEEQRTSAERARAAAEGEKQRAAAEAKARAEAEEKKQEELRNARAKAAGEEADEIAQAQAQRQEHANEEIQSALTRQALMREEQRLGRQLTQSEEELFLLRMGAYDELLPSEREQLRLILETNAALERQAEVVEVLAAQAPTFTDGLVRGLQDYLKYATDAYRQGVDLANTFFGSLEDTIVQTLDTGKFEWRKFGDAVIHEIHRIAAQALVAGLSRQLVGLAVNLVGSAAGASAAGTGASGETFPTAGADVGFAHSGAVIGVDSLPRRGVPAYTFAGAARFHSGGLIGPDEVPVIARRGERISTPEQWAAQGRGGGPSVNVTTNIDARGATAEMLPQLARLMRESEERTKAQVYEAIRRGTNP